MRKQSQEAAAEHGQPWETASNCPSPWTLSLRPIDTKTTCPPARRITAEGQRQMDLVSGSITVQRFHYL